MNHITVIRNAGSSLPGTLISGAVCLSVQDNSPEQNIVNVIAHNGDDSADKYYWCNSTIQ